MAEFEKSFKLSEIRKILHETPGITVQDNPVTNTYPMPIYAHDKDEVFVGRIRKDESQNNTLNMWIGSGILVEEHKPAIYILSQSFLVDDARVERISCICALTLSELGDDVLAHEQTIDKHLDDRYKLMSSTYANSGQIFMSYKDQKMILEELHRNLKNDPSMEANLDGVYYKLWPITDTDSINKFAVSLEDKKLVIADGHHRYKTCLLYTSDAADE